MMLNRMEDGRFPKEALIHQPKSGGNAELSNEGRAFTCQSKRGRTPNF